MQFMQVVHLQVHGEHVSRCVFLFGGLGTKVYDTVMDGGTAWLVHGSVCYIHSSDVRVQSSGFYLALFRICSTLNVIHVCT